MSSTTQILFHSPALNSLKRDQLVKLCKRHGLKASGKNAELIERLKQKASELPPEAIEWIDSEEEDDAPLPRPSEQWEIVMDNIVEEDETGSNSGTVTSMRSVRTLGTAGEFGTTGSKGSVKSSLKAAIANSFGLKRAAMKDLMQDAGTSRSLPTLPSQTSLSDFPLNDEPSVEPIPGAPSRPGKPAPHNARLSTGTRAGATTTIRLISSESSSALNTPPRLAPFKTTFDLDMGTPSATHKNVWPATPTTTLNSGRLYPIIPPEDLKPSLPFPWKSTAASSLLKVTPGKAPVNKELPSTVPDDIFSPAKPGIAKTSAQKKPSPPAPKQGRVSVAHDEPFLFGSPLPRHSMTNNQFDNAAASVLEEMNKRLAAAGVKKVEKTILHNAGQAALPSAAVPPPPKNVAGAARFAKAHNEAFSKMDSIVNHYAARRPAPAPTTTATTRKRKSEALISGQGPAAKRKSHIAQARVFSNGSRKKMGIPGGFGMDDDDDDDEQEDVAARRSSKRIKVSEGDGVHQGRRASLLPTDNKTSEEKLLEEKRRQREKEALKKKIEARRRSSRGRPSVGARAVAPPPKPKTSRFGFLGAARSLVRGVWNLGAGNPAAKPAAKPTVASAPARSGAIEKTSISQRPATNSNTKATETTTSLLKASETGTRASARSRSPLPSFDIPSQTRQGAPSSGTVPLPLRKSVIPKSTGASSLGARPSTAGPSNVSSFGIRRPSNTRLGAGPSNARSPPPAGASDVKSPPSVRKRTISTLMAPTASSLAKRQNVARPDAGSSQPGLEPVGENPTSPETLQQITNGEPSSRPLPSRPTKIFSQTLLSPESPEIPPPPSSPKENASLAATAHALLAQQDQTSAPDAAQAVPPKPRTLLVARKPRISRSKVIAKLGEQRSVSDSSRASAGSSSSSSGRMRSSMGAAPRRSMGAGKGQRAGSSTSDVLMSAKKKARQSEYIRRKSRIAAGSVVGLAKKRQSDVAMDIDH